MNVYHKTVEYDDFEVWIESDLHQKGDPYPQVMFSNNPFFQKHLQELNDRGHTALTSNEGIACQLDEMYKAKPELAVAKYYYVTLKPVRSKKIVET
jgi:hypothetical protein